MTYQVQAPHFCAGVVIDQWGIVIRTAPILRWAQGKRWVDLQSFCKRKGWKLERAA